MSCTFSSVYLYLVSARSRTIRNLPLERSCGESHFAVTSLVEADTFGGRAGDGSTETFGSSTSGMLCCDRIRVMG